MLYAMTEEGRMAAAKGREGYCPDCETAVIARCGDVVIWHWAHRAGQACDPWSESETAWHAEWKGRFPPECVEVAIRKDGGRHRADVRDPSSEVVIEFQHSSIGMADVAARESFYDRMIWVFDVREARAAERLRVGKSGRFWWSYRRRTLDYVTRPLFLDAGKGLLRVWEFGAEGHGDFFTVDEFMALVRDRARVDALLAETEAYVAPGARARYLDILEDREFWYGDLDDQAARIEAERARVEAEEELSRMRKAAREAERRRAAEEAERERAEEAEAARRWSEMQRQTVAELQATRAADVAAYDAEREAFYRRIMEEARAGGGSSRRGRR